MSQFISFVRRAGRSSHTAFAGAAAMANRKHSQLNGFLNRVAIFNNNKNLHSRTHITNSNSISYRNYTTAITNGATFTSSAPRNNLPRCSGMTTKNTPCQRDGINPVTESSTSANKENDVVVRYYCYQHDPRLVVSRRCLGYVASEHRQCRVTCSESEIRTGRRPICNRHYQLGARLVTHKN